ncbi:unnamed protein product [Lactuca virosa]|uniref:Uncharacterized protein n=1 Tax=Lactuca virosa TaxID=75947 RepID=A0AAU9NXK3_9ASTR|nr:unnamed protein product [Lactuca virosa]
MFQGIFVEFKSIAGRRSHLFLSLNLLPLPPLLSHFVAGHNILISLVIFANSNPISSTAPSPKRFPWYSCITIISIAFLIPQINQSYYVIIDRSFVVRRLLHQPVDFSRSASSLPRSSLNQR